MGATISNVVSDICVAFRRFVQGNFDYFNELRTDTHEPSIRRRISGSLQILCCEEGTECKLYFYIHNNRHVRVADFTIYQDIGLDSVIEVLSTNPRSGVSEGIAITCPMDARAFMDLFL